jgi:transcriptional regulator of met regulon
LIEVAKKSRDKKSKEPRAKIKVSRVQTGVRVERRVLSILKSVAAFHQISLSDLLEGIFLHSFEGKVPFGEDSMGLIKSLRKSYGLDLTAEDSHMLVEDTEA